MTEHDSYFNEKLRHGEVTIAELIENLRRFPQGATCKINRDMLSVKYRGKLHWLNDVVPTWECLIPAEVHTDDQVHKVHFDAVEFFEQASDNEIRNLHKIGWGGDYDSDYVAHFMSDKDVNVSGLFERKGEQGFECHIDSDKAESWVSEHRPELAKELGFFQGGNDD